MVVELLTYRFGTLTDVIIAQIVKLAEPQLKELAKALFGFAGPADLTAWLAGNVPE